MKSNTELSIQEEQQEYLAHITISTSHSCRRSCETSNMSINSKTQLMCIHNSESSLFQIQLTKSVTQNGIVFPPLISKIQTKVIIQTLSYQTMDISRISKIMQFMAKTVSSIRHISVEEEDMTLLQKP